MASIEESVAAATAVLGYNLLQNNVLRQSNMPRNIRRVGLAGSAAANDTKVDVSVGGQIVAQIFNKATGAVLNEHMSEVNAPVPPNQEISVVITDAAASNPINLKMEV